MRPLWSGWPLRSGRPGLSRRTGWPLWPSWPYGSQSHTERGDLAIAVHDDERIRSRWESGGQGGDKFVARERRQSQRWVAKTTVGASPEGLKFFPLIVRVAGRVHHGGVDGGAVEAALTPVTITTDARQTSSRVHGILDTRTMIVLLVVLGLKNTRRS